MGFMKKIRLTSKSKQKSKRLSKSKLPAKVTPDADDGTVACSCISLGTGSFSASGVSELTASLCRLSPGSTGTESTAGSSFSYDRGEFAYRDDDDDDDEAALVSLGLLPAPLSPHEEEAPSVPPPCSPTVFLRTADLPRMTAAVAAARRTSFPDLAEGDLVDHVHRPSSRPPLPLPNVDADPDERWVALDDGRGGTAPLTDAAMTALVRSALDACMDRGMWTEHGQTSKLLRSGAWDGTAWRTPTGEGGTGTGGPVPAPHARGSKGEGDVLVWSGRWSHRHYGHDIPAIRCEAIVNMSPRSMMELLVDSSRVKEYNKMSIGREDVLVLREEKNRVTKIMVARTKPPMIGKILVLKNLLHMEELPGGGDAAGYVVASRAIAHADDVDAVEDPKVVSSEMLMGLNVVRAVEGDPDRCVLINLNHLRSPMIPQMFAKKLGTSAAVNFINDIRALC